MIDVIKVSYIPTKDENVIYKLVDEVILLVMIEGKYGKCEESGL